MHPSVRALSTSIKRLKLIPAVVFILSVVFSSGAAASSALNIKQNVIYGMHGGLALLMDVYTPQKTNGIAIIAMPGNGFHEPLTYDAAPLNKKDGYWTDIIGANVLLDKGYTLFVINHRTAPIFRFPADIEDAQRAVRYVRHHATRFNINPEKIGAIGHSSGAYLASMLGVLSGNERLSGLTPSTPRSAKDGSVDQESSQVQAVVALAGIFDFTTSAAANHAVVSSYLGTHAGLWRGAAQVETESIHYRHASPVHYVSPDDAAFLIVHGDHDYIVPFNQSKIFSSELLNQKVTTQQIVIKEGNHSLGTKALGRTKTEAYYDQMIELFDGHLKGT